MALSPEKRDGIASVTSSALAIVLVALLAYVSPVRKEKVNEKIEAERLRIRAILSATTNSVPAVEPAKQPLDTQK